MAEHDVTKLPKWAQDRITRDANELLDLSLQLDEARGDLGKTRILLDSYMQSRYLEECNIEFYPGEDDCLYVKLTPGGIEAQSPNGTLVVIPVSSNVIRLRVEEL